jgi:glycosyltransferase involved in cell wall biosynthesis
MKIQVHILTYNEEDILPYTLRHYSQFATRIIVHDSFSTDRTREICKEYGAEVRDWDTGGVLNDDLSRELKGTAWIGTDADWVITADADELIYFPNGVTKTLEEYDRNNVHIVQPYGYEMYSENFPTGSGQIYDEVVHGARDDRWYSKPILFAPKRITKLEFAPGAHQCHVTSKLGERYLIDNKNHKFTVPTCWLLHCKHLGPIARVGKKYDVQRTRLAEINVKQKWGNFDPGEKHARDKRANIINKLEKIF